jgi:hypothetical protein
MRGIVSPALNLTVLFASDNRDNGLRQFAPVEGIVLWAPSAVVTKAVKHVSTWPVRPPQCVEASPAGSSA